MSIGKQIKSRREQLGITQEELAEKMGYKSKTTINKIEMGINEVTTSKARKFAEILDMSIPEIMEWENFNTLSPQKGVKINVVGRVAAGIPIEAIENVIDTEEIPASMAKCGEYFGLKIQGDSMTPRICDGDTVIVRRQDDAETDQVVIALINGNDATCKRLMKFDGGISLISFNPAYPPMIFTNEQIETMPVKIIGRVVENRQKY